MMKLMVTLHDDDDNHYDHDNRFCDRVYDCVNCYSVWCRG